MSGKNFMSRKMLVKKIRSKRFLVQKNLGPKKLKFGQKGVSNSWDTPDMDKCRQDKYCLDKCHLDSWHLLKDGPRSLPLKFGLNWVSNSWDKLPSSGQALTFLALIRSLYTFID